MTLPSSPETCDVEPFLYQATPLPDAETGASSNQINEQAIQDYLNRLREALCTDVQALFDEVNALDARVTALETP